MLDLAISDSSGIPPGQMGTDHGTDSNPDHFFTHSQSAIAKYWSDPLPVPSDSAPSTQYPPLTSTQKLST